MPAMPVTYQIDPGTSLVRCAVRGTLTLGDLTTHHDQLAGDPELTADMEILWDFSAADHFDHSAAKFAEAAEGTFVGLGKRRALVARPGTEVFQMLEIWILHRAARGDRGLRLFATTEPALAWLAQGTD